MDGGGGVGGDNNPDSSNKCKRQELFFSGPSPPFTQWVSIYLCEFMPSYCTPNPGAYLLRVSLLKSVNGQKYGIKAYNFYRFGVWGMFLIF